MPPPGVPDYDFAADLKRRIQPHLEELANQEQQTKWANERAERAAAEAKHFRKSRDGMKGALKKVAVRVKNGVCPCCKRTFKCLADHMKEKHPNFSAETAPQ